MFRASSCPSSGATTTAVAVSGLPSELGDSSVVGCGRQRVLRRRSATTRLLGLWVRILLEAWMFVCCECCVSSGSGVCDELITRPEESYRL
jgi:hypothetical protein